MLTTVLVNYNHARFLADSLGSLLSQTRPSDELIVIDDASTDNSVDVILPFLPRHPNARLIRNPVNQGCFANVNDGLRLARGTIVHLASADDVFYPRLYEAGMSLMEAHPKAGLFSSRSDIIDEAGRNLHVPTPPAGYPLRQPGYLSPDEVDRNLMREDGWFMGNAALFQRSYVLDEGGFPEELASFADGYMSRILGLKYGACFSPEILAGWRRMEGGFASAISANEEKARALVAKSAQRMVADRVFPASYVERWTGRQEFEIRRRGLAKSHATGSAKGLIGQISGWTAEKAGVVLLLLRYRPWDLGLGVRQYINHALGRTKS